MAPAMQLTKRPKLIICMVCIVAATVILFPLIIQKTEQDWLLTNIQKLPKNEKQLRGMNPLDGCLHVYLDVGSNIGIQVRKLFEPHLFPGAPVLDIFQQYFGPPQRRNLSQICSVGFEPNPLHRHRLQNMSSSYQKCGWRAIFYNSGVAARDGKMRYAHVPGPMEWGGFLVDDKDDFDDKLKMVVDIPVIRLATFIIDVVKQRKLPETAKIGTPPRVVMKLDIEGKEAEVIPDLLLSSAMSFVDVAFIEWHPHHRFASSEDVKSVKEAVKSLCRVAKVKQLHNRCNIIQMNDESYFTFNGSLPVC